MWAPRAGRGRPCPGQHCPPVAGSAVEGAGGGPGGPRPTPECRPPAWSPRPSGNARRGHTTCPRARGLCPGGSFHKGGNWFSRPWEGRARAPQTPAPRRPGPDGPPPPAPALERGSAFSAQKPGLCSSSAAAQPRACRILKIDANIYPSPFVSCLFLSYPIFLFLIFCPLVDF